jgi:GT2 family glycosyltransferase
MGDKNVLIIIVNYKTSHLMQKLLSTVQEERASVSILILDNASTPESYAPLELLGDKRVHLLKSEKNLGFAGGVNHAYKYALKNLAPFQYLFLFNPDAISCPNLISDLIDVISHEDAAAGVSPKILYLNGKPWYSGAQIDYSEGTVYNNRITEATPGKPYYEVDVFSGCAVLFDVAKISKAGALNEDLFMYYDEADFSIKLRQHDFTILYAPGLVIYHDVSYTTRNISHLKTYYMTRNKFMVFGRTMNTFNKLYFLTHNLLFHLKNRRFKNVYYHLKGYLDYKRGVTGQLNDYAK